MRLGDKQYIDSYYEKSNVTTCIGKKAFPSYKLASEFNNRAFTRGSALRNKGKKIERLHPYKCKKCGQFHLGHAIRTRQRRLQQLRLQQQKRYHGRRASQRSI